jgi:hypothetical protein
MMKTFNNIIEFSCYMPKISNLEIQGRNQNLQIILIIWPLMLNLKRYYSSKQMEVAIVLCQ